MRFLWKDINLKEYIVTKLDKRGKGRQISALFKDIITNSGKIQRVSLRF